MRITVQWEAGKVLKNVLGPRRPLPPAAHPEDTTHPWQQPRAENLPWARPATPLSHPRQCSPVPHPHDTDSEAQTGEWPAQGHTAELAKARVPKQHYWTRLLVKQHQLLLA